MRLIFDILSIFNNLQGSIIFCYRGPFELSDFVGLDVILFIVEGLFKFLNLKGINTQSNLRTKVVLTIFISNFHWFRMGQEFP